MNIRQLAFDLAKSVELFMDRARRFFHAVVLMAYRCPECNGSLQMLAEGKCKCCTCQKQFDPTTTFQKCLKCGGIPVLRIRRYICHDCSSDIRSKFLFDGLIFDPEYFRQKMAKSRQRKQSQREKVRQMLVECRSADLPLGSADLGSVPGLLDALNNLTAGVNEPFVAESCQQFDLKRYECHIQAHIADFPVNLVDIPLLSEHARKDLIWRFIAAVFLAHSGILDIWQDGRDIMVTKHETNRERQSIPGEPEGTDGIQRSMGGAEAW